MSDKDEVEDFVRDAQATLAKTATSIEEIGTARQSAKTLMAALPHIMDCRRRIEEKNRLLRTMAPSSGAAVGQQVDMTEVDNAWESFTAQLQQHDALLEDQKHHLQGQLIRQVLDCHLSALDTFATCFLWLPDPRSICHLKHHMPLFALNSLLASNLGSSQETVCKLSTIRSVTCCSGILT